MATLHEYFVKDFSNTISINKPFSVKNTATGETICVDTKACQEIHTNTRFIGLYIPDSKGQKLEICMYFLNQYDDLIKGFDDIQCGILNKIQIGNVISHNWSSKIYMYVDETFVPSEINALHQIALSKKLTLIIREKSYLDEKIKLEKPRAFISYDSRNKNIAETIAIELSKRVCPVWFDEFSLEVGDNLRESIEKGIKVTKKCILLLTPEFLSNQGWPKKEYDAALLKEVLEKNEKSILPIRHGVSSKEIADYSLVLAGKVALNWDETKKDEIVTKLYHAIVN